MVKVKKAFTLMEILIATAIFALIMVVTASTFSWAVSYNSKLKEMRQTAKDGMSVTESISSDIRLANGFIKEFSIGGVTYSGNYQVGEYILLNCRDKTRNSCHLPLPLDSSNLTSTMKTIEYFNETDINSLLILQQSKKKMILYQSVKNNELPYKEGQVDEDDLYNYSTFKRVLLFDEWPTSFDFEASKGWDGPDKLNGDNSSQEIQFGGIAPVRSYRLQQPFIEFYVDTKTIDYEIAKPNFRSVFGTDTLAESRYYNVE